MLLLHYPKDPLVPYFSSMLLLRAATAGRLPAKLEPAESGDQSRL